MYMEWHLGGHIACLEVRKTEREGRERRVTGFLFGGIFLLHFFTIISPGWDTSVLRQQPDWSYRSAQPVMRGVCTGRQGLRVWRQASWLVKFLQLFFLPSQIDQISPGRERERTGNGMWEAMMVDQREPSNTSTDTCYWGAPFGEKECRLFIWSSSSQIQEEAETWGLITETGSQFRKKLPTTDPMNCCWFQWLTQN